MKSLGLRSITIKKFNHSGSSKTDNTKEYQNLLEQDFFAEKPSEKFLEYAQMAGMAFLFALLLFANGNDIYRFFFK